jgi:outer membrane lipoprotein-sorting protein
MYRLAFAALGVVLLTASAAGAASPEARSLMERMKAALEPDRSSTRDMVMVTHTDGESTQWTARQARKKLKDGKRMLTVLLAPPDVKGFALLIQERRKETSDRQWLYLPYLRRVREILPLGTFETFLGTDFTTADLGFVDLRQRTFTLLGEEKLGNAQTYRVQETLKDPRYYSRIVTWIATDSMLPLQREYYDVADRLWKVERYENATVQGVPTPVRISMEDKQTGNSTELRASNVQYDVQIPDQLFDPARLPNTVQQPF